MAGAGVRVFQPGEVLTAALVNTYLQDQVVCRFDDAADRDSSFGGMGQPNLEEGRICYLDSTNELQYFDGTVWVTISPEAITGVIAAKGDIVIGTAPNTVARVSVGSDGLVLTANSSTVTGVAWTAPGVADGSVTEAKIAAGAVTSSKILDGTIVNADISSSAAIEIGKIADATIDTKTANYTLALTDKNKFIEMNLAGANTVSVPTNASVAFPIGSQIHITQYGAGKTQVVAVTPGTTTIRSNPSAGNGAYIRAQYSSATLIKRGTDEWYLVGDLSAT